MTYAVLDAVLAQLPVDKQLMVVVSYHDVLTTFGGSSGYVPERDAVDSINQLLSRGVRVGILSDQSVNTVAQDFFGAPDARELSRLVPNFARDLVIFGVNGEEKTNGRTPLPFTDHEASSGAMRVQWTRDFSALANYLVLLDDVYSLRHVGTGNVLALEIDFSRSRFDTNAHASRLVAVQTMLDRYHDVEFERATMQLAPSGGLGSIRIEPADLRSPGLGFRRMVEDNNDYSIIFFGSRHRDARLFALAEKLDSVCGAVEVSNDMTASLEPEASNRPRAQLHLMSSGIPQVFDAIAREFTLDSPTLDIAREPARRIITGATGKYTS
jgi:hypothetical protein